jgi:hypothetical protein
MDEYGPLTDEELTAIADEVFLELDRREAEAEESATDN